MTSETRTILPGVVVRLPPTWGIEPVPPAQRQLRAIDFAVLWGDLGNGLLVLLAGALLVPSLATTDALAAIAVGSIVGCGLLALAAYVSAASGVPTMVLTRAALGLRGSALPTVLNVVQLVGWTSFEILVMAQLTNAIAGAVGLPSLFPLWAFVIAAFCTALAIGGPLVVIRQWLERFAVWVMLVTTGGLFVILATRYDIGAILAAQGSGGLGFWAAVDIVIALPVSWFPLVSDYNRFARSRSVSFWGTFAGYLFANLAFFTLGALYVLALRSDPDRLNGDLVSALTAQSLWLGGALVLLVILADETNKGFANIYSTAVSVQNLFARAPQRALVVAAGALGFVLAVFLQNSDYRDFLYLIGSFFVPLLGVLAADFFVVRGGRYDERAFFARGGAYWYAGGANLLAVAVWLVGFALYQWISPTGPVAALALPPFPLAIGATIPSFLVAFALHAALGRLVRGRR